MRQGSKVLAYVGAAALVTGAAALACGYLLERVARAESEPRQPIPMNAKAPPFAGREWLHTGGVPLSWKDRSGKVTVVHFWTYGCINCRRNLPIYERWHERFAKRHVAIIGIHTPEFEAEKVPANVESRSKQLGIRYPVLLDPGYQNWQRWNQQFWPTVYLVDRKGKLRYRWEGEMNYGRLEGERLMTAKIEELLEEAP